MDDDNMYELNRMAPKDGKAKLLLLGNFDPEGVKEIRDPYYVSRIDLQAIQGPHNQITSFFLCKFHPQDSGSQGFEDCYVQAVRCCKGFLKQLNEGKI